MPASGLDRRLREGIAGKPASSSTRTPGATRAPPTKAAATGMGQPRVAPENGPGDPDGVGRRLGREEHQRGVGARSPRACSAWL